MLNISVHVGFVSVWECFVKGGKRCVCLCVCACVHAYVRVCVLFCLTAKIALEIY